MIPKDAIAQGLRLLPENMRRKDALTVLYAIGLQESRFLHRRQLVGNPPKPLGPAKGFWQFERGGGCIGVINHPVSRPHIQRICKERDVDFTSAALWDAIEFDDVLAAAAARLLLYTDPNPMPERGDVDGAWATYVNAWRPGKPHRSTWDALYAQALAESV